MDVRLQDQTPAGSAVRMVIVWGATGAQIEREHQHSYPGTPYSITWIRDDREGGLLYRAALNPDKPNLSLAIFATRLTMRRFAND